MIIDFDTKNVINGNYYVKLFQENDITRNYEEIRDCYFFVAKEFLINNDIKGGNINEFIMDLFNKKYDSKNYMKNIINVIYVSSKIENKEIFINSLKDNFNLEKIPSSINIQKYE
ncbi:MAG: hypothetical protein WC420_00045 [Candidatus Paceibacterota bacterium]|jgi:hypothetical protein